jgi:transcriptional regulator with XRE-family HTH domain
VTGKTTTLDDLARLLGMLPAILDRLDTQNALLSRLAASTPPTQPEPALMTVAEAARVCGVSSCTLRRWERDGAVQSVRRAHTVRIVASSLKPASADDISRAARAARGQV